MAYSKVQLRYLAEGLCITGCGRPRNGKKVRCVQCSMRNIKIARGRIVEYKNKQLAMGLCINGCGRPRNGENQKCIVCAVAYKVARIKRRKEKVLKGICTTYSCTNKAKEGMKQCKDCLAKEVIRNTLRRKRKKREDSADF